MSDIRPDATANAAGDAVPSGSAQGAVTGSSQARSTGSVSAGPGSSAEATSTGSFHAGLPARVGEVYRREVDRTHRSLLAAWVTFAVTFGALRAITYLIRQDLGPFGNVSIGSAHIHHYVWGIALLMLAGLVNLVVDSARYNVWLGAVYGCACALIIDEYALLLNLRDVYWSQEGRISVDVALGVIAVSGIYLSAATFWNRAGREVVRSAKQLRTGHD